jgi:4-amino-4-deoxy-L-arabinose transferase-like glycosyltransferase
VDRDRLPDARLSRSAGWSRLTEWWPLLVLAVAAFAIRWPNLWYIPQFTDEVFDAQVSYGIWEGKRPLTGVNAYTGAFHYYVQAGLFWLFGPSIYVPRLLVLVLGVGAVLATALLGAELGRRAARGADVAAIRTASRVGGLVAGGLLATSAVHVLTNSHLAWPHCTVLLYLTLAFWLVERAVDREGPRLARLCPPLAPRSAPEQGETNGPPARCGMKRGEQAAGGWMLVGAGLVFGLAQQQHPTMLLLWPVFLGYVGWRGRAYFRTRWAYAAILAFLVGISPLIVYNLVVTDFGTLKESREQTRNYQEGRDADGRDKDFSYGGRALEIAQTVPRVVASAIDPRPLTAAEYLRAPSVWIYSALALAGLVAAARLGTWSLPLAVVTFLLVLPVFPASHDNLPRQGRYVMPLVPLAFAGVGGLAAMLWLRARGTGPAGAPWSASGGPGGGASGRAGLMRPWARGALAIGLAIGLAVVVLYPLVPLARYEREVLAANETNDRYFVTLGALERQRRADEAVVLDPTLQRDRTGAAGTAQRTFDFMMELRGIPRAMLEESSERIARRVDGPTALVVADLEPSSLRNRSNADAWTLEPLANDEGGGFTLWRITRR